MAKVSDNSLRFFRQMQSNIFHEIIIFSSILMGNMVFYHGASRMHKKTDATRSPHVCVCFFFSIQLRQKIKKPTNWWVMNIVHT